MRFYHHVHILIPRHGLNGVQGVAPGADDLQSFGAAACGDLQSRAHLKRCEMQLSSSWGPQTLHPESQQPCLMNLSGGIDQHQTAASCLHPTGRQTASALQRFHLHHGTASSSSTGRLNLTLQFPLASRNCKAMLADSRAPQPAGVHMFPGQATPIHPKQSPRQAICSRR